MDPMDPPPGRLYPLNVAFGLVVDGGEKRSKPTLQRDLKRGLWSVLVGGRRHTSVEAVRDYIAKCTARRDGDSTDDDTPRRSPAARRRASDAAAKELAKMGI